MNKQEKKKPGVLHWICLIVGAFILYVGLSNLIHNTVTGLIFVIVGAAILYFDWYKLCDMHYSKTLIIVLAVLAVLFFLTGFFGSGSTEETVTTTTEEITAQEVETEQTEDTKQTDDTSVAKTIEINETLSIDQGFFLMTLKSIEVVSEDFIKINMSVTDGTDVPIRITDILGWDAYQEWEEDGKYETFSINSQADNPYHKANLAVLDKNVDGNSTADFTLQANIKSLDYPLILGMYPDGSSGINLTDDNYELDFTIDLKNGTYTTSERDI